MRNPALILVIGLVILAGVPAVSAETITAYDVNSYEVSASDGYVIYEIIIDNMPVGTNQTHVLNSNGATFLLNIGSVTEYGIVRKFDISLTFPNGSTTTIQKETWRPIGTEYKTTIQPVFPQAQSATNVYWTIDLQVGLTPLSAEFNTGIPGLDLEQSIPFSSASGEFGGEYTTVYVVQMTNEDYINNVQNYNPVFGVQNLGSQVFQWSMDQVYGLVYMVPVIGPAFLSIMESVKLIITQIIYWLNFFLLNIPLILFGLEVTIFMLAFIMAGKKPKPGRVLENWIQYNVKAVHGLIWIVDKGYTWTREFLSFVWQAINALKPI